MWPPEEPPMDPTLDPAAMQAESSVSPLPNLVPGPNVGPDGMPPLMDPLGDPSLDPMQAEEELPPAAESVLPAVLPEAIDYTVRLSPEKLQALGKRICREVEQFEAGIAARRANVQEWERDLEMLEASDEGPWENSSALRAPFTSLAVVNHAARLNGQIVNARPAFSALARKAEAQEAAAAVEEVLQALMDEARWSVCANEAHTDLPLSGLCLVGTEWEVVYRRCPAPQGRLDERLTEELLATGADPEHALAAGIEVGPDGKAKLKVRFEDVKVKDGVRIWTVPFSQAVFLPLTATCPEELWGLGQYVRLRGLDLKYGAKQGKYLKGPVADLLLRQTDAPRTDSDFDLWEEVSGVEPLGSAEDEDPLYREYECVELDYYADLDGDGGCEWYLVTVHRETERVLRLQYNPAEHGMSRYECFGYIKRPGRLISASVAERLAAIQNAATVALNSLIDLVDVLKGNTTSFLYDFRTGIKPGAWTTKIGVPKYVNSVEGTKEMPGTQAIPAAIASLLNLLNLLKNWSDLVSATNNNSLGQVGDDATATESKLAAGANAELFGNYAQWVAESWARVADRVRFLAAQYGEHGKVRYRVTAEAGHTIRTEGGEVPGRQVWQTDPVTGAPMQVPVQGSVAWGEIPAEWLKTDVDLVPNSSGNIPTREGRVQRDMFVYQLALGDPVLSQMPRVLTTLHQIILQDTQFPQRDKLSAMIQEELQAMQQAQAMAQQQQAMQGMAQLALQAGEQEQAAEAARADREGKAQDRQFQQEQARGQQALQQRQAEDAALQGLLGLAVKDRQVGVQAQAAKARGNGTSKGGKK